MSRTALKTLAIATASLMALAAPAMGQDAPDLTVLQPVPTDFDPPRTSWGDPDLRGMWPIDNIASIPMQRPAQFGDRFYLTDDEYQARLRQASGSDERYEAEDEAGTIGFGHWVESDASGRRTSLLVSPANGQLPALTEWAQHFMAPGVSRTSWTPNTQYNWVTDFDSWDRCVSRGFPASMFPFRYNNGIRVMQSPGQVVISLEMIHDARVIPIVANKAEADARRWPAGVEAWMGQSIGWWEGNTLVIETTNIQSGDSATTDHYARNGSPLNMATMGVPPFNIIPTSTQASSVERLTMTGPDAITYEITYSDPQVFTAPWTARLEWTRNNDYEFFEYACHEGDVQIRNYINASRAGVQLSGENGGLE